MVIDYCPVCGYGPALGGAALGFASTEDLRCSFEICDCCGCEYGYSDNMANYQRWVADGCPWRYPKLRPLNWSLEDQLMYTIRPWPPGRESVTKVTIERFVDEDFPGLVECALVDSKGYTHRFVAKAPLVSTMDLSSDSTFPRSGYIACVVESEWTDDRGRQLVRVGNITPWDFESKAGEMTFTVLRDQIGPV